MNDLFAWLSRQHHGLGTFRTFQRKLDDLIEAEPEHRALWRLLAGVAGRYIETFDEKPLPVAVADGAHQRLLELVQGLDLQADAERRLADLNRVAACELWRG